MLGPERDMRRYLKRIAAEDGGTAVEYALIAALISVFLITAVSAAGGALQQDFQLLVSVMK
jgi:Flp pilus assembly pilin Flp